jgi:probable HAF family extracellular repeat protein
LGTLGGRFSQANSINDVGQVVGYSYTSAGTARATLFNTNGLTPIDLGTLGDTSIANSINNSGQVVGFSMLGNSSRATLWDGNNVIDLNNLLEASTLNEGWVLQNALDINDNGWIVGYANNSQLGLNNAFLLSMTPVPEADTSAMLLMGAGMMGFMARRRQNTQA